MIFNSSEFFCFLLIFLGIYISASRSCRLRNLLIFSSSLLFYGWANWPFIFLLLYSTFVDFIIAKKIEKAVGRLKVVLLITSLVSNLGVLFYFKYFSWIYGVVSGEYLSIFLPIGISFYTFQTLSYTIDVYRGKLSAENDFLTFASFVTFFPQLVAGPIERAINLLPQFKEKTSFRINRHYLDQIVLGFYQKIILGDGLSGLVDRSWESCDNGFETIVGIVAFSIQIYGDFAGYSNIAIGIAGILGFKLMCNFNSPYSSASITEFWGRWHISLSSWFRDYVYIPLGGNRKRVYLNVMLVFLVSGIWHGASFTFVVWGLMHGCAVLAEKRFGRIASFNFVLGRLFTLFYVGFAWVFFRAPDLGSGVVYLLSIFEDWSSFELSGEEKLIFLLILGYSVRRLFSVYWNKIGDFCGGLVLGLIAFLIYLLSGGDNSFIYFQF